MKTKTARLKLSDDARAVAGAWFGMMRAGKGELRFQMEQSRPAPRAQAGLDELVAAKVIKRSVSRFGVVTYVPLVDCAPHRVWLAKNVDRPKCNFALTEPIPGRAVLTGGSDA